MALVVEDGTGLEDAEAYISVEDSDSYFDLYGIPTSWVNADEPTRERALRNGARYLDGAVRWPSKKLVEDQALEWPREPFFDTAGNYVDSIPRIIKESNAELAALHLESSLFSTDKATVMSESWGDSSVTYATGASTEYRSKLDAILKRLSRYGGNSTYMITTFRA